MSPQPGEAAVRKKRLTFVDMLGRGVEEGETEEREEPQSSPLGHHFSQINLCRLREPWRTFKKEKGKRKRNP